MVKENIKKRIGYKESLCLSIVMMIICMQVSTAYGLKIESAKADVDDMSEEFAVIDIMTDNVSRAYAKIGESSDDVSRKVESKIVSDEHSIYIGGLSPGTKYYYSAGATVQQDGETVTVEDNNSGEYYEFVTLEDDNIVPYIDTVVPEYSGSRSITISGKTEPNTYVELWVNGQIERTSVKNTEGKFSFASVRLNAVKTNSIKIVAKDSHGNINEKVFDVTVDDSRPRLEIDSLPSVSSSSSIVIRGRVSKEVDIKIYSNDNILRTIEGVTDFNETISLSDGNNKVVINATDRAMNSDTFEKEIQVDTTPLEIESISPEAGSIFYEGFAVSDIDGKTKPFSDVALYVVKDNVRCEEVGGEPDYETSSDSQGYFSFEDVNLEEYSVHFDSDIPIIGGRQIVGASLNTGDGFENAYEPVAYGAQDEAADISPYPNKPDTTNVKMCVLVMSADNVKFKEVNYRIGTCFSGNLDWSVQPLVEYQAPSMLSPERLSEGTEIITTLLKLEYIGQHKNASVQNVRFERFDCSSPTIQDDDKYKYSCNILPTSQPYKNYNEDRSLWYIRYELNQLDGVDGFSEDLWEDLTRQFSFPLKLKVSYTYTDETGVKRTGMQQVCIPLTYALDTSRIDPRDVLPDWLQEEGVKVLNESVAHLNDVIRSVDKVVKYSAIGCLAGFGLKTVTVIYRRMMEWSNYLSDRADTSKRDSEKCPIPRKGLREYSEDTGSQQDLYNEELKERCPQAYDAWEAENQAYEAYRWACDRFLCKSAPAKWTADKEFSEIRVKMQEGLMCKSREGTEGIILQKVQDCKEFCTGYEVCYQYQGEYYVYKTGTEMVEDNIPLYPCGRSGEIQVNKEPLYVTSDGNSAFIDETPDSFRDCSDVCTNPKDGDVKWPRGECMTAQQVLDKFSGRIREGESGQKESDSFERKGDAKDCSGDRECYCFGEKEEAAQSVAEPEEVWDYRLDKIGLVEYPSFRYYEGRDKSACFGQDHMLFGQDAAYMNPSEAWPAFQCLCVTQIRNRLVAFKNILGGLLGCIQQIKSTGKADHGICKELFTQYVCKWMYRVITWFMKGCAPWAGTGKDVSIGDTLQAGTDSIFGGVFESSEDILNDYDSPGLRNYLGVGPEAISNKVCLGALTGNWGFDLEGFIDAGYSNVHTSSVYAWPADREYLTWNPANYMSTYDYRIAWAIVPGCDISSYSVKLVCANSETVHNNDGVRCEQAVSSQASQDQVNEDMPGCDCYNLENEMTKTLFNGRNIRSGSFVENSVNKVIESAYRYDNVKVELYAPSNDVAEQCFGSNAEGRKGVYYFPISDGTIKDIAACRFDLLTGKFVCREGALLWEKRGFAYFGDIGCDNEECRSSDENVYYLGETINLDPLKVHYTDKRQCLNIQMYNSLNKKLLGEEGVNIQLEPDGSEETYTYDLPVPLKQVQVDDFSYARGSSSFNVNIEDGLNAVRLENDDPRQGSSAVYVHRTGSGYEYLLIDDLERGWIQVLDDSVIDVLGIMLRLNDPAISSSDDECNNFEDEALIRTGNCRKFSVTVTENVRSAQNVNDQTWKIHVELRHAPGEENEGLCYDSVSEDVIKYQNIEQKKDLFVRASPMQEPECIREKGGICRSGGCSFYMDNNQNPGTFGCARDKYCCINRVEDAVDQARGGEE